jgi:hypothetical protein
MKSNTFVFIVALVFNFSTPVFAKGPIEYTESSKIFLILNRALKDAKDGKAEFGGGSVTYEALKLSGFRVSKVIVVDMGDKVHLQLEVQDAQGKPLKDWKDKTIPSIFFLQAPANLWHGLLQ